MMFAEGVWFINSTKLRKSLSLYYTLLKWFSLLDGCQLTRMAKLKKTGTSNIALVRVEGKGCSGDI